MSLRHSLRTAGGARKLGGGAEGATLRGRLTPGPLRIWCQQPCRRLLVAVACSVFDPQPVPLPVFYSSSYLA